jgi:hypothetical protein
VKFTSALGFIQAFLVLSIIFPSCAHSQERGIVPDEIIESTVWEAVRSIESNEGRAMRKYGDQWVLAKVQKTYTEDEYNQRNGPVSCHEVTVVINGIPHNIFYKVCLSCGISI